MRSFLSAIVAAVLIGIGGVVWAQATSAPATPAGASSLEVWNSSVLLDEDLNFNRKQDKALPIEIVATRGGAFSGTVVIASKDPMKDFSAKIVDLSSADGAKIPLSAVTIRYALAANWWSLEKGEKYPVKGFSYFGGLSEKAPRMLPVIETSMVSKNLVPVGRAVQPVWVTVNVPADAKPGEYTGTLKVTAGAKIASVPVKLTVCGWRMPAPHDFTTFVDVVQAPETIALAYDVPMWSDEHFKLMENSLKLLGSVGNRTAYVQLVGETNQGNAYTMVLWTPQVDGTYKYDFTPMNRYLDMVEKSYGGKPAVVCLYIWDAWMEGGGHRSLDYWEKQKDTRHLEAWSEKAGTGPIVTVKGTDGKLSTVSLPSRITPQGKAIWTSFSKALMEELKKRKIEDRTTLGMLGDQVPSSDVLDVFSQTMPGLLWVKQSHSMKVYNENGADSTEKDSDGFRVKYGAFVWGAKFPHLTDLQHGWQKTDMRANYPRSMNTRSPVLAFRHLGEMNIGGSQCGFGRIGGDFWPVLKNKRDELAGSIQNRYPHAEWKNLDIRISSLAPGIDGAIATRRFEMMREGVQECEARIFIDKALVTPALRAKLGAQLADKCEKLLKDRNAAILKAFAIDKEKDGLPAYRWMNPVGKFDEAGYANVWQGLSRELFTTAAEVAEKLGSP